MTGRPMRPGQDRHDVGQEVADLILPGDGALPAGIVAEGPLGAPLAAGNNVELALDDPFDHGRRITAITSRSMLRGFSGATIHFRSRNKLDVDAAYQGIRKRLGVHGAPERAVGTHLVFRYALPGGGSVSLSRYKDDDGFAVLHVSVSPA